MSNESAINNVQVESAKLNNNPALGGAKAFLIKKLAAANNGQSFYSPTDTMMSPCTQKLVQSKKRHYTKGKPLTLSSAFQQSTTPAPAPVKSGLGQSQENINPGTMTE